MLYTEAQRASSAPWAYGIEKLFNRTGQSSNDKRNDISFLVLTQNFRNGLRIRYYPTDYDREPPLPRILTPSRPSTLTLSHPRAITPSRHGQQKAPSPQPRGKPRPPGWTPAAEQGARPRLLSNRVPQPSLLSLLHHRVGARPGCSMGRTKMTARLHSLPGSPWVLCIISGCVLHSIRQDQDAQSTGDAATDGEPFLSSLPHSLPL